MLIFFGIYNDGRPVGQQCWGFSALKIPKTDGCSGGCASRKRKKSEMKLCLYSFLKIFLRLKISRCRNEKDDRGMRQTYFGTGETFLFKLDGDKVLKYPWVGENKVRFLFLYLKCIF